MVMVELHSGCVGGSGGEGAEAARSGGGEGDGSIKTGISQSIAWQYAVTPLVLSLTMTASIGIALQLVLMNDNQSRLEEYLEWTILYLGIRDVLTPSSNSGKSLSSLRERA